MNQTVITTLIGSGGLVLIALLGFFGGRLASRDTRQATREAADVVARIDERKVNLEEFREVQNRNEAAIKRIGEDLDEEREARRAAEARAEEERAARKKAEGTAAQEREARKRAERDAARVMSRLSRRVTQLEQVMVANDLTIPPPPADDDL